MRRFGLIGHPLGHSLSPQIHTRLFELSGEAVDYNLYDITPEDLKGKFDFLAELDGFNVTIPHKVDIIGYCDRLSEGAELKRWATTRTCWALQNQLSCWELRYAQRCCLSAAEESGA